MKHITILLLCLLCLQGVQSQNIIWPGDINNNGVVNEVDMLFWGIAYGQTGPSRMPMDSTFIGYPFDSLWAQSFPMGPNYAYADANGDGVVNNLDLQQSIFHTLDLYTMI